MTTKFQFKNAITLNGVDMLVTPCADPMEYETPFDYIYETPELAIEGLQRVIDNQEFDLDLDTLVLVKVETTIIADAFASYAD